jgi:tRNA uridine 5-carboxymethylaminomethyl modification enzyme
LGLALNQDGVRRSAFELLSYPAMDWEKISTIWAPLAMAPLAAQEQISIDAKYAVYLDRQQSDLIRLRKDEALDLSVFDALGFGHISGLSNEIRVKLDLIRPRSIAQARQIEGMTPAGLLLLAAHARRGQSAAQAGPV